MFIERIKKVRQPWLFIFLAAAICLSAWFLFPESTESNSNDEAAYAVTETNETVRTAHKPARLLMVIPRDIAAVGLALLFLAGTGGYFLAARNLKKVKEVTAEARTIEENNLEKQIDSEGRGEIGFLASTFNRILSRLQTASQREREFTADASHELRAPLAVIQGEASLTLIHERTPEEYQTALQTIYEETRHMNSVLKNLLFLARYESWKDYITEKTSLGTLLNDMKPDMEILSGTKHIACTFIIEDDLSIMGNRACLQEMVFNILDNAIRYTGEGGEILVDLAREKNKAVISVSDTGTGIEEKHLPHIFERFYRADRSEFRSGAGLGLAISLRIAELHRGKITVQSRVGRGSTFSIYLPLLHGTD
jgi:signal transduction histidine kinase